MVWGRRQPTYGTRLRRALVLMLAPALVVGVCASLAYGLATRQARSIAQEAAAELDEINATQTLLREAEANAVVYAIIGDPTAPALFADVSADLTTSFDELARFDNERHRSIVADAQAAWAAAEVVAIPVLGAPSPVGNFTGGYPLLDFHIQLAESVDALSALTVAVNDEVGTHVDAVERNGRIFLALLMIVIVFSALVSFVLAQRLHRSLYRPLLALEEGARRIGRGEVTYRVDVAGPPELDRVAIAFNEMTESVEKANERLRYQAFHEVVTGFPNRTWLEARVDEARRQSAAGGPDFAVIAIRLEGLATVVELLGHDAGDELLVRLVERLTTALRGDDRVARPTPDELALVVENLPESADATDLARRLVQAAAESLQIGEHDLRVSASAGVALPNDEDARTIVRYAEIAATVAERAGRGQVRVFTPEMHRAVEERQRLETELRHSIEQDELVVHYQPIVNLRSGHVVGVEALVRMRDPNGGLIPPDRFIPLAEATGIIGALGERVLERACGQLRTWHDDHPGLRHLTVSVNLSPRQLHAADPTEMVARVLKRTGLPAESLTLEVTESAIADKVALRRLRALKGLGVKISLDDFGTGYSALSVLTEMPIDILKIDKSFVDHAHRRPDRVVVARAVIRLATSLGMQSVAEGVEVDDQVELLRLLGCNHAQGYRFARPLPPEEVEPLLSRTLLAPESPAAAASPRETSARLVHVTLGPLPSNDALAFVRYATTVLDQVESEELVPMPPPILDLMRRFLHEWAVTASASEIFEWTGDRDAQALQAVLHSWQAIAGVQAERAFALGKRLASPEVEAFTGELLSAMLTALAADAEEMESDAVEMSRDWPRLEG